MGKAAKKGKGHAGDQGPDSVPSAPPTPKPPAQDVRGADGRFQNGNTYHRGPDRKPRQVNRLALTRALMAVKQKNGRAVPGVEALAIGYREILGNHNHKFFLQLGQLIKETFDDAPDSGSGRTTVFLFPSEVEEEMRNAGQPIPSRKAPEGPPGPLAGMEELEEPPG